MDINRFVFVWFVLLLFLFCQENAVSWNRVWSDVWPPRRNSTYLLFVLVSTLANVTTPGCERGTEQKHHKKGPTQPWFRQDDRRRRSLPLASPLDGASPCLVVSRRSCVLSVLSVPSGALRLCKQIPQCRRMHDHKCRRPCNAAISPSVEWWIIPLPEL